MYSQALRVALALALFKSGPQDMPFSWSLTRLAADLKRLSSWVLTLMSLFVLMGFVLLAQVFAALLFGVR